MGTEVTAKIEYRMVHTKDEIQDSFEAVMNPTKERRKELSVCEVNSKDAPICIQITEIPEYDNITIWLSIEAAKMLGEYILQKAMNAEQKKAISDVFGESYAKL